MLDFFSFFRNQLKKSLDDGVVKCHGTILSQRRGLGLGGADQGPCHIYTRTTELDYSGYVGRRRRPHGDLVLGPPTSGSLSWWRVTPTRRANAAVSTSSRLSFAMKLATSPSTLLVVLRMWRRSVARIMVLPLPRESSCQSQKDVVLSMEGLQQLYNC